MSMWQDAFEVYQSAQSGEPLSSGRTEHKKNSTKKTDSKQQIVYIFAYLTDEEGKSLRDLPTKDRLTSIELRLAELNERFLDLDTRCRELEDYLDMPTNE